MRVPRLVFALAAFAPSEAAYAAPARGRARPLGRAASAVAARAAQPTMAVAESLAALSFADRLIAGSIARTVAQTMLHPLDTLRTRAQARKRGDAPPAEPLARTLLRGIIPQVLFAGPAGAIQFATLEWAKAALIGSSLGLAPAAVNLLAAAAGAMAAASIRVPQENMKQPVQAGRYESFAECVGALSAEGPLRFYRGLQSTMLRDVPWNALSFCFFKVRAGARCVGWAVCVCVRALCVCVCVRVRVPCSLAPSLSAPVCPSRWSLSRSVCLSSDRAQLCVAGLLSP
jgi:solute carrier family 25 S-adenosylmethionine transporter 26